MDKVSKVEFILEKLSNVYPNPRTALEYSTPFELLVATILSAQCRDTVVNTVTPALFAKYNTPGKMALAEIGEIDKLISKISFHLSKAGNLKAASTMICGKYEGEVPDNMEDLDSLPGVARKTANVVLGDAFGKPEGIVVDTHVIRLSQKYGLVDSKDPVKIELELMGIVPKDEWVKFAHYLILHGRECCTARGSKPGCLLKELY